MLPYVKHIKFFESEVKSRVGSITMFYSTKLTPWISPITITFSWNYEITILFTWK